MPSMYEIKPSRGLLSAYYIAILFSSLAFSLPFFQDLIFRGREFLITAIQKVSSSTSITSWISYGSLVVIAFLVVFLVKRYIVEPLGFYMDDEDNLKNAEKAILVLLVFGCFFYFININFGNLQQMPLNISPVAIELLGGKVSQNMFSPNVVDGFWKLGPIIYFFVGFRGRHS